MDHAAPVSAMAGAGKAAGARAARARAGIAASLPARAGIAADPRARARIVRATLTYAPNITAQPIREEQPNYRLVAPGMSNADEEARGGSGDGVDEVNTSILSVKKLQAVKLLLDEDAWRVSRSRP